MSAENVIPLTFQERRISAKAVCARQANPSPQRDILAVSVCLSCNETT